MSNMKDTETAPRFFTVGETAQLLNVSPRTLYAWVSQGRIPYRKAGPRRVLFLESELLEWTKPNYLRHQYLELMGR
jgi:excisionase family DNA binding protein